MRMSPTARTRLPQAIPRTGLFLVACLLIGAFALQANPPEVTIYIHGQPTSPSLGAEVFLRSRVTGEVNALQWRHAGADIAGATNAQLRLQDLQSADAGSYTLVIRHADGETESAPLQLEIDQRFIVVTDAPFLDQNGHFTGGSWGDYNNDGHLDLLLGNLWLSPMHLYQNRGDGTFSPMIHPSAARARGVAWGDYDGDGYLDIYYGEWFETPSTGSSGLLHNDRQGGFDLAEYGPEGNALSAAGPTGAWGDFDRDGDLDLCTVHDDELRQRRLYLFHRNLGDAGFRSEPISDAPHAWDSRDNAGASLAVGDLDLDGDLDLISVLGAYGARDCSVDVCLNRGDGTFELLGESVLASITRDANTGALGDYDNDGDLDYYLATAGSESGSLNQPGPTDRLYRNTGNGTFVLEGEAGLGGDPSHGFGAVWGDFDNDGDLDLFVASTPPPCLFYENDGTGHFTRVTTGNPVWRNSYYATVSWADYNNDGFLDLLIGGGTYNQSGPPALYRNAGNGNAWVRVQCRGQAGTKPWRDQSNGYGIGAKVWVTANIRGQSLRQFREITGGDSHTHSYPLEAHFGLGDASRIDLLRIEWPSGMVQELADLEVRQILTVQEPILPHLVGAQVEDGGILALSIEGEAGQVYECQSSTDLAHWTREAIIQNPTGTVVHRLPMNGSGFGFYRLVLQ